VFDMPAPHSRIAYAPNLNGQALGLLEVLTSAPARRVSKRRSPGAPLRWERSQRAARAASFAPGLRLRPATQDGPGDAAGHRIYPPVG